MREQLLRELRRGMIVVTADGDELGHVAEVYHTGLEPRPEPGTLITSDATEAELTGEGFPAEAETRKTEEVAAGYGEPGPVLEPEGFLRVDRGADGKGELFVPFSPVDRVDGHTVVLRLTHAEVERQGWGRKPRLVRLAESKI